MIFSLASTMVTDIFGLMIQRIVNSCISVYQNGKPLRDAVVFMQWADIQDNALLNPILTNSIGEARFEHRETGEARIYINETYAGTVRTPGRFSFDI